LLLLEDKLGCELGAAVKLGRELGALLTLGARLTVGCDVGLAGGCGVGLADCCDVGLDVGCDVGLTVGCDFIASTFWASSLSSDVEKPASWHVPSRRRTPISLTQLSLQHCLSRKQ
jgi:hypothetical protein